MFIVELTVKCFIAVLAVGHIAYSYYKSEKEDESNIMMKNMKKSQ
jgi:hypothetical protein